MRVAQQCSNCQSIYGITDQQYSVLSVAYCPACGHANSKRPEVRKKICQMSKIVIDLGGNAARKEYSPPANMRRRAGEKSEPKHIPSRPVDLLQRRVEEAGKVFFLDDRPEIRQFDLEMLLENKLPIFGTGRVFELFPKIDALFLPPSRIEILKILPEVEKWQKENQGRWIFWPRTTEGVRWVQQGAKHGFSFFQDGQQADGCGCEGFAMDHSCVSYYEPDEGFSSEPSLPLRLSEEFPALNLAWLFGAREAIAVFREMPAEEAVPEGIFVKQVPPASFEHEASTEEPVFVHRLRQKIHYASGKVFLLGAAPSLKACGLEKLFGFPVIGTNSTFQAYPHMDALCFGDRYFVEQYHGEIGRWQSLRDEKPVLFWQNYGGGSKLARCFGYIKGQPSKVIHENPNGRVMPIFSLKHSIVTAAINCAYWLGAREIFLLGVEFGAGHFFDPDGAIYKDLGKVSQKFPNAEKIVPFVKRQAEYLLTKGVALYTCWDGDCALRGKLPYLPLDVAADSRYLSQLGRRSL